MTRETLDKLRAMGMNLGSQYDSLAEALTRNRLETEEAKINAKTFLSIKYISAEENLLNHLITFSIEGKNVKNTNGFISLLDAKTSTIISTIEVKIENRGISKQFSFIKNNLFTYNPQEVIAKLYCDGNFAETKKFQIGGLKKVKTCYCNRDFTVDEMKEIVEGIRDNTYYKAKIKEGGKLVEKQFPISNLRKELFNRNNETYKDYNTEIIPVKDRTYEKLTSSINETFRTFNINNCIKKIHFLSQMTIETAYFTSTIELKNEKLTYDDYRGRGFLQLTHKGDQDSRTKNATSYLGYKLYSNKDVITTPSIISKSIEISSDSAGWFWTRGVRKNDGSLINLNLLCKDTENDVEEITRLVKGAPTELQERKDVFNILKTIFIYEKCKNKK